MTLLARETNDSNEQVRYQCEYCEGTVRPKNVEQVAFKPKKGFVILENVTIGVCVCAETAITARTLFMLCLQSPRE